MRTTLTLDDDLLARAHELTGTVERSTLLHDGLRLLIQRESARRLALLGGSDPTASAAPRRRAAAVNRPATKSAGLAAKPAKRRAAAKGKSR